MPAEPHRYRIVPANPGAHLYEVTLQIARPDPEGQVLSLPAWIPGSYLVRDFARNIVAIGARAGDRELELVKLDKSSWQLEACQEPVIVT